MTATPGRPPGRPPGREAVPRALAEARGHAPQRISAARMLLRQFHLWLGLSLGALFALIGLTGSALVFYVAIDAALNPLVQAETDAPPASWESPVWDRALATGRANFPAGGDWSFEATGEGGPIPARYYPPVGEHAGAGGHHAPREMVWFSPDGGEVVRVSRWGDYAMSWIYELHMNLLAGDLGMQVVGWSGYATLVLLLTGVIAWWPRGSWRKALAFKRRAASLRRLRDLHKLAGLSSLILLFLLVLTGAFLSLPAVKDQIFAATIAAPEPVPAPELAPAGPREVSLAQALLAARATIPQGRMTFVDVPGTPGAPYRVRVQGAGDPHSRFPGSFVFVDRFSGEVAAVHDTTAGNPATRVSVWIRPIHDGSIGGMGTRVLAVIAGLVPSLLFVTGLLHWLRRKSARRHPRSANY